MTIELTDDQIDILLELLCEQVGYAASVEPIIGEQFKKLRELVELVQTLQIQQGQNRMKR
jgi:hypothetical protein